MNAAAKIIFTWTEQEDSTHRISDGMESVWICWPDGASEQQVMDAYAAGYDFNGGTEEAEIDVYDADTNEHLMCWDI